MLSFMNNFELNAALVWLAISLSMGLLLLLIYPLLAPRFRQPLLLIQWVLLPYVGLITGGLSPRLLGLTGINWLASFGLGLGLIGILLLLLIFVRTLINLTHDEPTTDQPTASRPFQDQPKRTADNKPSRVIVRPSWSLFPALQIGAEEFYWSFLRGALWETLITYGLTTTQASYWAIWLAALLALPAILRHQPTALLRLFKGAMLLLTTVLFFYTHNFWLCWFLHTLAWSLLSPTRLRLDRPVLALQ